MARKPNYDFEKRRKEQERKAKQDAKAAAKAQRKRDQADGLIDEFGNPVAAPENEGTTDFPRDADG